MAVAAAVQWWQLVALSAANALFNAGAVDFWRWMTM